MTDREIIDRIKSFGIDRERLSKALDIDKAGWGKMVHAFEFVTVLGVVEDAMKREEAGR